MNIGTVIGTVRASDNIAVIYYVITAGDSIYSFSINTNGQIKTIMRLDYDTRPNYQLTVQVADAAGNTSNAIVTVSISDVDAAPTVSTMNASGVQNYSVILNGNLSYLGTNSDGNGLATECGFVYSSTASQSNNLLLGENNVEKVARFNISSIGNYSFAINGLALDTAYYFRAFAVNDGGTNYGEVKGFSTTCSSETFSLIGDAAGEQSNLLCPYATHGYNIPLSDELVYSLSVKGTSNISSNVTVYEGHITEPLFIQAGPFSRRAPTTTVSFPGLSDGTRYMVLPLVSNSHRIVISNDSGEKQSYNLNLEQYQGNNPATDRLLVAPQKMGYYDSPNDARHFWVHVPANKNIQVELDEYRGGISNILTTVALNYPPGSSSSPVAGFTPFATNAQTISVMSNQSYYSIMAMRNTSVVLASTAQQTNARFILRFIDP